MMRLIVNADDFGYSESVNDAIKVLFANRRLTSSTIMMNQVATDDAVSYANQQKHRQFGLHLNLDEGNFLSNPERKLKFAVNYRNLSLEFLEENLFDYWKEIDEQIRIATTAFHVTHLDGHHHIHTFPLFWYPVMRAAQQNSIPAIRNAYTYFANDRFPKKLMKNFFRKLVAARCIRTTDYFFSIDYFMSNLDKVLKLPVSSTIELMCHPDISKPKDFNTLMSKEFAEILQKFNCISFVDI